ADRRPVHRRRAARLAARRPVARGQVSRAQLRDPHPGAGVGGAGRLRLSVDPARGQRLLRRRAMKRLLLAFVVAALGCHGARLDGFLYAPVTTNDYALPTTESYTELTFPSTDGVMLHAVFVSGTEPVTLVYCHGQGGDI